MVCVYAGMKQWKKFSLFKLSYAFLKIKIKNETVKKKTTKI